MEETGIEAEFVRVVGIGEDPVGHYVQLKPTRRLPESWEHIREDGPVHCRWIPVSAEAEVWGLRGDFISALVRKRAVGYVIRGFAASWFSIMVTARRVRDVPPRPGARENSTSHSRMHG